MEEKYRDMGCGKVSEKDIGKEINLAHCSVIVFSEEFAKQRN